MKEKETIPDWLKERKEKESFTVPENYFEEFETAFLQKLHEERRPPAKVLGIKSFYKYAVAAVVTGLVLIAGWQINGNWGDQQQLASFSDMDWGEVETTLEDLPTIEIVDMLSSEDFETLQTDLFSPDAMEVEQFLLEDIQVEDLESLFN